MSVIDPDKKHRTNTPGQHKRKSDLDIKSVVDSDISHTHKKRQSHVIHIRDTKNILVHCFEFDLDTDWRRLEDVYIFSYVENPTYPINWPVISANGQKDVILIKEGATYYYILAFGLQQNFVKQEAGWLYSALVPFWDRDTILYNRHLLDIEFTLEFERVYYEGIWRNHNPLVCEDNNSITTRTESDQLEVLTTSLVFPPIHQTLTRHDGDWEWFKGSDAEKFVTERELDHLYELDKEQCFVNGLENEFFYRCLFQNTGKEHCGCIVQTLFKTRNITSLAHGYVIITAKQAEDAILVFAAKKINEHRTEIVTKKEKYKGDISKDWGLNPSVHKKIVQYKRTDIVPSLDWKKDTGPPKCIELGLDYKELENPARYQLAIIISNYCRKSGYDYGVCTDLAVSRVEHRKFCMQHRTRIGDFRKQLKAERSRTRFSKLTEWPCVKRTNVGSSNIFCPYAGGNREHVSDCLKAQGFEWEDDGNTPFDTTTITPSDIWTASTISGSGLAKC